jgi:hypothetical protein
MAYPEFHSPHIRANIHKLTDLGNERLAKLDKFNVDIKSLERMFKIYALPDIDIAFFASFDGVGSHGLAWSEDQQRIYYVERSKDDELGDPVLAVKPLIETTAKVRNVAREDKWLDLLFEKGVACLELMQQNPNTPQPPLSGWAYSLHRAFQKTVEAK